MDFRKVKDRNLFLDNNTIPRTFNALEANLAQKPKEKDTMKLLQRQQLQDSRKAKKNKLKVKDGCPPNKRFSL